MAFVEVHRQFTAKIVDADLRAIIVRKMTDFVVNMSVCKTYLSLRFSHLPFLKHH